MKNRLFQFSRWMISPFLLKCYAGCLLGLILLITLFYLEENWRGAREWENAKAELAAQGETLDFDKLIPPPVPDEENFCSTPLIKKYLEERKRISNEPDMAKREEMEKRSAIIQTIKKMSGFDPFAQNEIPNYKITKDTLRQWRDYYMSNPAFAAAHPNVSDAEAILLHFQEQKAEWEELKKATYRRFSLLNEDYSSKRLIDSFFKLPLYDDFLARQLPQGLSIKAKAEFASLQNNEGMSTLNVLFKLNEACAKIPLLAYQLASKTISQYLLHQIKYSLKIYSLKENDLNRLSTNLRSIHILQGYSQGIRGEIHSFSQQMDFLKNSNLVRLFWKSRSSVKTKFKYFQPTHIDILRGFAFYLYPDGWYDLNKVFEAQYIQENFLPFVNSYKHRAYPHREPKCIYAIGLVTMKNAWASHNLHAFPSVRHFAQAQADVDMTIIACELEKYYLNNKKYPSKLEELKADIPHDVMSGEPYHYQQTPSGRYKLWSVGWNGTNENGTLGYLCNNPAKNRLDPKEGDWVWSYEDVN